MIKMMSVLWLMRKRRIAVEMSFLNHDVKKMINVCVRGSLD
jgi:hypothetical protein